MKTLKIACTALILLAGVFAAACSTDPETEAADRVEIDGLDDGLHFPYHPEESASFSISSNKTWSISKSGLDWLTVSQMNGGSKLPATISLSAAPNDDLERSGELTIYTGAYVQTVTVTQEAFPIVPTLTLDGLTDNTLEFEFSDLEPVTFTLYSNIAWTADKQGLDWAEVSPLSGERKQEATITVTPSANGGDARQGTLSFWGEGMTPVVVTVRQTAYRDDPLLTVTGFGEDNTLAFPEAPEAPAALQILCNRNWTVIKEGLDWLTVAPESGTAGTVPADITLTASKNTGDARTGTLTIRADDPALEDVVITVSQEAKSLEPIAWWTLSDEALKQYSGDNWLTGGRMFADKPAGTTAYGQWNKVNDAPVYDPGYVISSDGKGHYAVKSVWTDDNLEFTIPVKNFAAGQAVNIRYGARSKKTGARYWIVEYFDQGTWKPTSTKEYTFSGNGLHVTATYELTKADKVENINETARFTEAVDNGVIRFRIRCVTGTCTIEGKVIAQPSSGAAPRFCQWSTGDHDAIAFYLVD
ncbi:BACON domain-containing protein [Alistipes provencensis]|uniref:BACON domain-containing protein n=1 Tax=Alistipes provencensis TaxID=1816676 RepID=UPI0007ECC741|nr:BACON domain-containing protein [Alistipes provencensis]